MLLTIYETSIVSSLVHNAESWTLLLSEETQIDMIGIKAIKPFFSLPTSTPSAAVLFNLGLLYITQVVDKMRFLFLHKIINRPNDHWTNQMLKHLQSLGIGWAKSIHEKLNEYELENDWEKISRKSKAEWKKEVQEAKPKKACRKRYHGDERRE